MVYIAPNPDAPRLKAYLLPSFPASELAAFKHAFELGTCAPFDTMLELVIQHAPKDYAGKSYEYMRKKEHESGNTGPFILVDARGAGGRAGAVWYVDQFATQDEVDDGEAVSTDVVWRILVKTDCLALTWANYDIANTSLQEDLEGLGVELPVDAGYEVGEADCCGGLDVLEERGSRDAAAVVARPGEFEESTDDALRADYMPRPARVVRLREGLAETLGVVNAWTIPSPARSRKNPDGSRETFPKGSVALQLRYDPNFDWPRYEWPEGSL
ncbi:hypothetical protein SAMD00023353_7900270 [Rosellinia necatrix]|uniref:Uncharacterized protein n=1 Tax=Rosellinia necatrix TaxID=77044 RepID=A0A1W2TUZ2_ROSNE|nr:hypothetical protein SAMD00023353_7900270 [Rosellinia necatrix]